VRRPRRAALTPRAAAASEKNMQAGQLKILTAAVKDIDAALATFQKNFGFALARREEVDGSRSAFLRIGASEIELAASSAGALADAVAQRGEGLFQIELEVDDLHAAQSELVEHGIRAEIETDATGRRVLRVPAEHTHGVPMVLSEGR
jgi:catechol 2,3-dioxygenase-like lactoylglutathione lyase family enzyme